MTEAEWEQLKRAAIAAAIARVLPPNYVPTEPVPMTRAAIIRSGIERTRY